MRCNATALAKLAGVLTGGAGGTTATVETGATGAGGQRRDFAFRSPESLRPRTFLFDLRWEEGRQQINVQIQCRKGILNSVKDCHLQI